MKEFTYKTICVLGLCVLGTPTAHTCLAQTERNIQQKKVEILVAPWCPHCLNLERFLKEKHIQYTAYDIEKDPQGVRMYQELGASGLPILKIGATIIKGFNPVAILSELAAP